MFVFEKSQVYIKSEEVYLQTKKVLTNNILNKSIKDQLYRASLSIILNIAEGSAKLSKKEKRNFYTISRGSVQECVAILRLLKADNSIDMELYNDTYNNLTEISKMLSGLINSLSE
jgi:four helix bundle protein